MKVTSDSVHELVRCPRCNTVKIVVERSYESGISRAWCDRLETTARLKSLTNDLNELKKQLEAKEATIGEEKEE